MADKYLNETGLEYFLSKLKALFQQKESGKGLSTNDYTTTEKTKLSGIATGAEVNQNAFGVLEVTSGTSTATSATASSEQDTISLNAGNNVTLGTSNGGKDVTISAASTYYGTCPTAADTAAKVVTLTSNSGTFKLEAGVTVNVLFTYTNTASNPTLNVNSTGAKSIRYNTSNITTGPLTVGGTAGRIIQYVYNGSVWCFTGWGVDNNTNTTYSAGTGLSLSSTTFSLASGVVTAGSAGPTAAVTGSNGTTIAVPRITVDTYGRVTGLTSYNYTSVNTDTNTTYSAGTGIALSGTTFSLKSISNKSVSKSSVTIAAGGYTSQTIATGVTGTNIFSLVPYCDGDVKCIPTSCYISGNNVVVNVSNVGTSSATVTVGARVYYFS